MARPMYQGTGIIACNACRILPYNYLKAWKTSCNCRKKAWKAAHWAA